MAASSRAGASAPVGRSLRRRAARRLRLRPARRAPSPSSPSSLGTRRGCWSTGARALRRSTATCATCPSSWSPATSSWSTTPGSCRPGCGCTGPPAAPSRCCCWSRSTTEHRRWECLVRPARRAAARGGAGSDRRAAMVLGRRAPARGRRHVRLVELCADDPSRPSSAAGEVPLPPYITAPLADPERYQTVYAGRPGSAAAPTAGLHLTAGLLDALAGRGRRDRPGSSWSSGSTRSSR